MASETRQDPERIYLEPAPYSPEGRLWCEDDVWPLDGDGPGGVEYVRADLHDAEVARLTRELEEARERERGLLAPVVEHVEAWADVSDDAEVEITLTMDAATLRRWVALPATPDTEDET